MAISSFLDYVISSNGHTQITVLPDGTPTVAGSMQPQFLLPPPAPEPAPAPATTPLPFPAAQPAPTKEPTPSNSLNSLVEKFRAESRHLAEATRSTLECHFKVAARHLDFKRDVSEIRLADLRKLKSQLSETHKASSVNDIVFKGLGKLFRIAVEDELIEKSPLEKLQRARAGEPNREQPSWDQSQQIIDAIARSSPETGLITSLMRNFGVGQAEVRYLHGEQVDLGTGIVHFRRKKTCKPFDVPIFTHAKPFIETLRASGKLRSGKAVVEWRNPRKAMETACKELGLPNFTPRALRRTFIIHCLERGVEARVVAEWQGHADATLIFKVYGKHISKDHAAKMAEKLS